MVTAEMLQGQWVSNCDVDDDGQGIVSAATYSGDEFTLLGSVYADPGCSSLLYQAQLLGDFSLGETLYAPDGIAVTELDEIGDTLLVKPEDSDLVVLLNEDELCGFSDWSVGEFKNITTCDEFGGVRSNFGIVRFDESSYLRGDDTDSLDGSSASKRPLNIDFTVAYGRVSSDDPSQSDGVNTGMSRGASEQRLRSYLDKLKAQISGE